MSQSFENPFAPGAESPSLGEALKDPIGLYLKRHPSEKAAVKETAYGMDAISPEHKAEILGGAYRELLDEQKAAKKGGQSDRRPCVAAGACVAGYARRV